LDSQPKAVVTRFRENLEISKRPWTEDRVTLKGRFSQPDNIPMESGMDNSLGIAIGHSRV
jgi:hypothetical protein